MCSQAARAAVVVYSMMRYKEKLEREEHEPTMVGEGAVPLCMWQYERMFATSRIPGRECDEIKHWDTSEVKHIAVYCKGSFFKVNVYRRDGRLRTPDELETVFQAVARAAQEREGKLHDAEACVPALTGDNRTKWAEVREGYLLEGATNRRTLLAVESALIYVVLSDKTFEMEDWSGRGKYLIGGDGDRPDIWFDKSVNLVIGADGKAGLNCEHSWADAPVAAHLFEIAMIIGEHNMKPYDDEGAWAPPLFAVAPLSHAPLIAPQATCVRACGRASPRPAPAAVPARTCGHCCLGRSPAMRRRRSCRPSPTCEP